MRIFFLTLMFACLLAAQETRTEVLKPTTPKDDAKANNPSIPDVFAISSQFQRVVILRFKYQADLLAGMEKVIKDEKIKNAVILAGAGSVTGYQVHSVTNSSFPSKNTYVKNPAAPADVIGMNGYVIGGKVHAHMTMANPDRAFGGHLEPGTTVFTFAIVTLGVLDEALDLSKLDDKTYR